MICPFTKETICHFSSWIKIKRKELQIPHDELKFKCYESTFGDITKKNKLIDFYINQRYSPEDFHKQFGLDGQQLRFLIKWYKLPNRIRNDPLYLSERTSKYVRTCQTKYGVENISQLQQVKDKKKQTCLTNWGATSYLHSKDFVDNADWKQIKDRHSERNSRLWANRTPEEKRKYLTKSLFKQRRFGYPARSSKIENRISAALKSLGIEHSRQFTIHEGDRRKLYDIFIPNINTILEVNGTYWHADPRFYKSDELMKFPSETVLVSEIWKRDSNKIILAQSKGYTVVSIWQADVQSKTNCEILTIIKNLLKSC